MTKDKLREIYLERRLSLSEKSCSLLSHVLYDNLASHFDLSMLNVLHTYLPMAKNKEPDTWLIIDWVRMKFPDVRIALPRVNYKKTEIESVFFDDRFQLQTNKWGLEEPYKGVIARPQEIDLVIVPLLAVDRNGNRVGYGKGYYDKFLSTCRKDCKKVGLSFFEPVDVIEDLNPFDVPLDYCITPINYHAF